MTVLKTDTMQPFTRLQHGFPPDQRAQVTAIYMQAFGPKLGRILGTTQRAQDFVAASIDPAFAITAMDSASDQVIGIAGYRTERGGLTNRFGDELRPHYGQFGGLWRGIILDMLETPETSDKFLVDGIAIADSHRGQGIGTSLLHALEQRAVDLGKRAVRLDVIDRNDRARALYARQGYQITGSHDLGVLQYAFGFRHATQMTKML
ncbi:Acetyltransferase (GNAT) family protein [Monaibacterium marinum]|uniref:Acetyltransferase (GNAT) family protein n=2 Tax=Pontivivens marinum TaxID=1690039 RepID=A0A2C9CP55_9RHOB|nr:Acetyltransferase (GNAT) family protein [Monaibacterium marinum]